MSRSSLKALSSILFICVTFPIWFYLLYQILKRVQASELMMFLFWVYVPVMIGAAFLARMLDPER